MKSSLQGSISSPDPLADVESFFPQCTDESCKRPRPHHCILPFQREILLGNSKYTAILGGYGSGKSLAAVVQCILLSLRVRGNRGIVLRHSYPKLHDSTERIFLEVLARKKIKFRSYEHRDGWPHRIVFEHNESEIVFRDTKDPGKFLGPEYGWFYIDEASEQNRKLFIDLTGRLRLPQAARYLRGILTTNPPHQNHWIAEVFGTTPGTIEKGGTRYTLMRVSTRVNPYLPPSYLADLLANNPESEVRRIIDGDYGFVADGKPVYAPPFDFAQHVGEFGPLKNMAVVRGFDFGFHAPAIGWHQFPVCTEKTVHWRVVHEYLGRDLDAEPLAAIALDETRIVFPDHPTGLVLDCGDAAGAQKSDKGPSSIARLRQPPYNLVIRYKHLPNIDPGIALIRKALRAPLCKCGLPVFQVNRTCRFTTDGLAGGYHYPNHRPGLSDLSMKPVKDGIYDNMLDQVRYVGENFYRGLMVDPEMIETLSYIQNPMGESVPQTNPWAWMQGR